MSHQHMGRHGKYLANDIMWCLEGSDWFKMGLLLFLESFLVTEITEMKLPAILFSCFFCQQFCSWENPHFSSTVLSELLWQVSLTPNSHVPGDTTLCSSFCCELTLSEVPRWREKICIGYVLGLFCFLPVSVTHHAFSAFRFFTCLRTPTHAHTHTHTHICMHAHRHVCTHTHTHRAHMHACIHVCACTHTRTHTLLLEIY